MKIPVKYNDSVGQLLDQLTGLPKGTQLLFRGQSQLKPLLPKIARTDPARDTGQVERRMLEELKRRTARAHGSLGTDDWDALVVAQHFGMSTRLLDWSTNPLVALWFAIADENDGKDAYVYILPFSEGRMLDRGSVVDPFTLKETTVFKPSINNERIAAQSGWFTAHHYCAQTGQFVDLENQKSDLSALLINAVRGTEKKKALLTLDRAGINHESLFPGLEGTCKYIDWASKHDA